MEKVGRLSDVITLRGAQESASPAVGGWGHGSAVRRRRLPGLCLYTSHAKRRITSILSLERGFLTLSQTIPVGRGAVQNEETELPDVNVLFAECCRFVWMRHTTAHWLRPLKHWDERLGHDLCPWTQRSEGVGETLAALTKSLFH